MYSASFVESGAAGLLNTIVIELPVDKNDCICSFVSGLQICEMVVFLVSKVPSRTSIIDLQFGALNIQDGPYQPEEFQEKYERAYVSR